MFSSDFENPLRRMLRNPQQGEFPLDSSQKIHVLNHLAKQTSVKGGLACESEIRWQSSRCWINLTHEILSILQAHFPGFQRFAVADPGTGGSMLSRYQGFSAC